MTAFGNIDIDAYVALLKRARDTGKELLDIIRNNPELKALREQFEALLGKSTIDMTDAEIAALTNSWYAGNKAKSKDLPPEQPDPPKPKPVTAFPYKQLLHFHPLQDNAAHLLDPRDTIYETTEHSAWLVIAWNDASTDWDRFGLTWERAKVQVPRP